MNHGPLLEVIGPNDIALAEHAAVIRALGKRVVGDVIEIGRRLTEAKKIAGHGGWLPWLEREFGWVEQTALNFMRCHDLAKSKKFGDLDIPVSGLYLLAAPSTPDEAREEIIERSKNGKGLSHAQVKEMIDEAREQQQAKHAADLDKERGATERRLAELREQLGRREKEIRDEYADKIVLDEDDFKKLVTKHLKPLQRELEATERRLASAEKRLEKQKDSKAAKAPTMPKIDATISLRSTSIKLAVERLAADLLIVPKQMIDVETKAAQVTGEHVRDRIGKTLTEAVRVVEWLNSFITIAKESCK